MKLLNEDTSAKAFINKLGREDIQYFGHKNAFNYDIKQVRIDNNNKTYEIGNFRILSGRETTKNGREFNKLIQHLKDNGYKEVGKENLEENYNEKAKGFLVDFDNDETYVYFIDKEAEKLEDILTTKVTEFNGTQGFPKGEHKFTSIPYSKIDRYKDRIEIIKENLNEKKYKKELSFNKIYDDLERMNYKVRSTNNPDLDNALMVSKKYEKNLKKAKDYCQEKGLECKQRYSDLQDRYYLDIILTPDLLESKKQKEFLENFKKERAEYLKDKSLKEEFENVKSMSDAKEILNKKGIEVKKIDNKNYILSKDGKEYKFYVLDNDNEVRKDLEKAVKKLTEEYYPNYDTIVAREDIPEYKIKKGDKFPIIDYLPNGVQLYFENEVGEKITIEDNDKRFRLIGENLEEDKSTQTNVKYYIKVDTGVKNAGITASYVYGKIKEFPDGIKIGIHKTPYDEKVATDIRTGMRIIGTHSGIYQGKDLIEPKKKESELFNQAHDILSSIVNTEYYKSIPDIEKTFSPEDDIESEEEIYFDRDNLEESLQVKFDESLKEELSPEQEKKYGLGTFVNDLIKSEFDAINDYNSAIVTFEAEGKGEFTDIIRDIISEEHKHVGQLQTILKELNPQTTADIDEGEQEGQEQLGVTEGDTEETTTTIDTEEGVIKTYKLDKVEDMKGE